MSEPFTKIQSHIEQTALRYFMDCAHPKSGLVRDMAANFPAKDTGKHFSTRASIAATGFGLAVMGNAAARGLISAEVAKEYARKTIRFVADHVPRKNGWFCHFVDWETGERVLKCEFSNIDTALFMAGALYVTQVCHDPETYDLVREIYRDLDFHFFMTNDGEMEAKRVLSMGWHEDTGFTELEWDSYSEQMLLLILGLGHPTKPLPPECWLAWNRYRQNLLSPPNLLGIGESLFTHQYSFLFLDMRDFRDDFNINYFENSARITRFHRGIMQNATAVKTLAAGFWGFSAGDAKDGEYRVYNALDRCATVCLGAAITSSMFLPEEVLKDASLWKAGEYGDKIWGRYGFSDSIDLDVDFFSEKVFAITKGPEFLALGNIREETSVWTDFMQIPEIHKGMQIAATVRTSRSMVPMKEPDEAVIKALDEELRLNLAEADSKAAAISH